jgi:hypothetical protein
MRYVAPAAAWTGTPRISSPLTSLVPPGKDCLASGGHRLAGLQRPGGGLPAVRPADTSDAATDHDPDNDSLTAAQGEDQIDVDHGVC